MPCFCSQSWMNRATSSSLPVGVGMLTTSMASLASSSRSMWEKTFSRVASSVCMNGTPCSD